MCSATRRCPADKHPSPEKRARKNARRREARAAKKKAAMVASKVEESLKSSPKAEEVTVQLNTAAPDEAKVSVKKGGQKKKQSEVTAMEAPEEAVMEVTEIETPELSEAELHERALAATSKFMDRTDTFNDMEFKDLPEKVVEDGMTEKAWNQLQAERRKIEQAHEAERSLAAAHELLEDDELDEYVGQNYDSLEGLMKDRGISREAWDQVNAEQQERSDAIDARHGAERAEEVTQDYLASHMDEMDKEYDDLPDYAKKDGVTEEAWNKAAGDARAERDAIRAEEAEEATQDYLEHHKDDIDTSYDDLPAYAKKDGVTREAWEKATAEARAERDAVRAENAEVVTDDYLTHHMDDMDTDYDDLPSYVKKDGVTRESWEKATAAARAERDIRIARENASRAVETVQQLLTENREMMDTDYDDLPNDVKSQGVTKQAWDDAANAARNERLQRGIEESNRYIDDVHDGDLPDSNYDNLPDYVKKDGVTREAWDRVVAERQQAAATRREARAEEVAYELTSGDYGNDYSGVEYDYLPEEYKSEVTPEVWERVNREKSERENVRKRERARESSREFIERWGDPRDVRFDELFELGADSDDITPEVWEEAVNEWKRDNNIEDEEENGYDYY